MHGLHQFVVDQAPVVGEVVEDALGASIQIALPLQPGPRPLDVGQAHVPAVRPVFQGPAGAVKAHEVQVHPAAGQVVVDFLIGPA